MPYLAGYLTAGLLLIAEDHRDACQGPPCPTCTQLAEAVAVVLGAERIHTDAAFRHITRRLTLTQRLTEWPWRARSGDHP
jgi:hypothetical protein